MSGRTLLWLLAALALGMLAMALQQLRLWEPVEGALARPLLPIVEGLGRAFDPLSDYWSGLGGHRGLLRQNDALRQERERLLTEIARLREEVAASQQTAGLAQVTRERPDDRFLLAQVIARDPSPLWQAVAIDRGRRDAVEEGMVVLGEGGSLLGTVARVDDDFSWVTLINDPRSSVTALLQPSRAQGVASGGAEGRLALEYVPQGTQVNQGDLVITSGLGGGYPKALLIGRVTSVKGSRQEPFLRVSLEPATPLERLEKVLVLTSFHPASLERGSP
ncbi:MAG TPA: rod shape-determining protein MreC [Dehalococcoidia bacterium]|nr:rod shape-determining protein MreC [Dehalococcoidia bacterium]